MIKLSFSDFSFSFSRSRFSSGSRSSDFIDFFVRCVCCVVRPDTCLALASQCVYFLHLELWRRYSSLPTQTDNNSLFLRRAMVNCPRNVTNTLVNHLEKWDISIEVTSFVRSPARLIITYSSSFLTPRRRNRQPPRGGWSELPQGARRHVINKAAGDYCKIIAGPRTLRHDADADNVVIAHSVFRIL
jgi:hypothetical protein